MDKPDNTFLDPYPDTATVMALVEEVFVLPDECQHWLNTYNPDVGGVPQECLTTPAGRARVWDTVNRIQYGVFA